MCTAISYKVRNHYFGRNLDMECTYGENVIVMPRSFPFAFRYAERPAVNYAIIGAGLVRDGVPLFYDGTNEKGLSMAGLAFYGNAHYGNVADGKDNVAPFELIPWVLLQCETVKQARELLGGTNVAHIDFSASLPCAELHWMISDDRENLVLECTKEGMRLYDNPSGVLTNNPPFPMQVFNLNNYMCLSNQPPVNSFSKSLSLQEYSRGMGAIGLPGDLSSQSRFVRAVFNKMNSVCPSGEVRRVSQFFHLLYSVYQTRGAVQLKGGRYEYTVYSSCCNTKKGIYYYTAYDNFNITAIDMKKENLDGETLAVYSMRREGEIAAENQSRQ